MMRFNIGLACFNISPSSPALNRLSRLMSALRTRTLDTGLFASGIAHSTMAVLIAVDSVVNSRLTVDAFTVF